MNFRLFFRAPRGVGAGRDFAGYLAAFAVVFQK
jgi:hypothetical protein